VLELQDVSLQVGAGADEQMLLSEVSAQFPRGHFIALLGPSGCGKSTLLKVIAGLLPQTIGKVRWEGRDLTEETDLDPREIGYVPQFGIAFERLTVWENLHSALRLRIGSLSHEEASTRIEAIIEAVGLKSIEERAVSVLSGGQRRRLALALELLSSPNLLLCDEVTSGLDPKSEDEIVHLMQSIAGTDGRLVINVTHSLRHLALHDSVLVLYHGNVAYHGAPETLFHYFGVEDPEELFPRLGTRRPEEWHRSWIKHRAAYYSALNYETASMPAPTEEPKLAPLPSVFSQFAVLLARRWKLFFRDRGHLALHLALLFGFPLLVVLFATKGLPTLPSPSGADARDFLAQIMLESATRQQFVRTGTLVSGLVMFQVILLALMGANSSAREIAGERLIFEKEKLAGLQPVAYVASKIAFLGILVAAQSLWMAGFVNWFVRFPGNFGDQALPLVLVNAAITSVCLGLSSLLRTPEQASLVSIYLVGFQLPLSGAVLALPEWLAPIARPAIASYWGWSGFIDTMKDYRYYEAVKLVTETPLSSSPLCLWFLVSHVILGFLLTLVGCKASRWE
jgi:ABC-type multidrug transport system ATPase subunit